MTDDETREVLMLLRHIIKRLDLILAWMPTNENFLSTPVEDWRALERSEQKQEPRDPNIR